MDPGHGDGIGAWDSGNYAGEAWDHHFSGSGLTFDQNGGADNGYANPDFLGGNSLDPQLSGSDPQAGLYRQFGYYGQGDVWSDHPQTAAAPYGQDASLHQHQGYYADQRHPTDTNQTVDSRFALNIQQGNEFPAQLSNATGQQAGAHHGFGSTVANARSTAPDGFPQGQIPQWQGQAQAGYGSGHQFENPLAASQSPNIPAPVPTGSPSPFFSSHGPAIQAYQTDVRQQTPTNNRHAHPQFSTVVNGQTQQSRSPAPQQQQQKPVSVTPNPLTAAQPAAQNAAPQQLPPQITRQQLPQQVERVIQQPLQQPAQHSVQQPVQQPIQQSVQQPVQQPAFQLASQPVAGQTIFPQEPVNQTHAAQKVQPSPEKNSVAGVKRASTSEFQAAPVVAKKAKVLAPVAACAASPLAQPQPEKAFEPICTINYEDAGLLAEARRRPDAKWQGVPNLVVGSAPVKLQKGPPTKRYVLLATKGWKNPLFPKLARGWILAESLGNHADAYQKATSDLDCQRADIRLDIEMKRAQNEVPPDWWKKGLKDRLGKEPKRLDAPAEPVLTSIKAAEVVRVHPAHITNQTVTHEAYVDVYELLRAKAAALKSAYSPTEGTPPRNPEETEAALVTAKDELERALVEVNRVGSDKVLAKLTGKNNVLPVMFRNFLTRLIISRDEANSPLAKAILHMFTRFTNMDMGLLKAWNMNKVRERLKKYGDDEANALMARVYEIAEENSSEGSSSASDSPAESGGRGKKTTQTRALSKQPNPGSDSKKTATGPSTFKPTTSTTDSKKLPSTSASKTMAPGTTPNKLGAKTSQKMAPTSAGTKRSREDDAVGGDARSSKKPAPSTAKAPATATAAAKAPGGKPSAGTASGPAATQAKPRSGLLLPGKVRPISKPVAKPELAQKSAAKAESGLKAQPAKADGAKLPSKGQLGSAPAKSAKPQGAEAKPASSSKSFLSGLLDEIHEDKKIIKPEPPAKVATPPDPNETPEQRERRLRKEKRRSLGLKVAFRSGDRLVEVREFTRHPDEIAEVNMARNVKTDGRDKNNEEGQMMKKLHGGKGVRAEEINDREWDELIPIDFTARIPPEKREYYYVTRGGLLPFETPEQTRTKEREMNELMAIYHNRSDIPPTPRSPPHDPSAPWGGPPPGLHLPSVVPGYDEIMQRIKEYRQWGPYHASRAAQARLDAKARLDAAQPAKTAVEDSYNGHVKPDTLIQDPYKDPFRDPRHWYAVSVAIPRDQQTLELLNSDRVKNWKDPDPYLGTRLRSRGYTREAEADPKFQEVQKALANLERISESLKANEAAQPAQAAQPTQVTQPAQITQPAQQEVSQPAATAAQGAQAATPDYSIWAQYYAAQQQQQAWYAQYNQAANPYAQPQAQQTGQPQQATDLAGILAALGNQQQQQQPVAAAATQPQYPPAAADPNTLQAVMAALAQQPAAAATPAAAQPDPQSAQYLLDMMKWAQQNQGAGAAAAGQAATYPYGQAQTQQGYGSSNQDNRDNYGGGYDAYGHDRDRDRDNRDRGDRDRDNRDRGDRDRGDRDYHNLRGGSGKGGGGGRNNGGNVPDHLRGINRSLIGTKQCSFWAKGQCAKGDKCTFRHD